MIPAYDRSYLLCAKRSLGRMLDFACHEMGFAAPAFWRLFLSSGVADDFGAGVSHILAGMSGIELTYEVLDRARVPYARIANPVCAAAKSPEYWAGWALADYQWQRGLAFAEIDAFAPIEIVIDKYWPFHEMDIGQFADEMDRLAESPRSVAAACSSTNGKDKTI